MTQEELRRLEMNLTKSDSKAKPGYLRGKHGLLPEDQSFMPLDWVPLFTYKEGQPIKMAEFVEDYKALEIKANELQLENQRLNQALLDQNKQFTLIVKQLEARIKELEIIQAENDSFVIE